MKKLAAGLSVVGTTAYAGFGGMANVSDPDDTSHVDVSDLLFWGLIAWAAWLVWKKVFG